MKTVHSDELKALWIRSTKSSCRPVIKDTAQVSIWEPILFNTSINNLQGETECTFCKFTDNTKWEVVDVSEGCAAIKRNLDRLRKEQKTWNATKGKCKVLYLWRNTKHQYGLGAKSLGSSFAKWDLRVLVDKLTVSQQCALTAKKAHSNLTSPGGQKRCSLLLFSTSEKHLEGWLQPRAPHYKRAQWRKFHEGQQRWFKGQKHLLYEKLNEMGAFSMVKRSLRGILSMFRNT